MNRMKTLKYFELLLDVFDTMKRTQTEHILTLAAWMADTIQHDHLIYVFGAGHAGIISEEMCYRAGSLVPTNAIFAPGLTVNTRPVTLETEMERVSGLAGLILASSGICRGDLLIVHSNSGRNTVAIEMAEIAKEQGVRVVALTSVAHSTEVSSRHPKGYKLMDIADLVLDNCGIPGDAIVAFDGYDQKSGATSTVIGAAMMNAAITETVQILLDRGVKPPVFRSANLDGSDAHNRYWMEHYAGRLIYL